jgi:hypothetical protein
MSAVPVTFYFDPTCPWAWMTSRWMTEVEGHRDVDVTWRVMSLKYLNEDRDIPEGYRELIDTVQDLSGAVAAAVLRDGQQVAHPLYTALGHRIHPGGRRDVEAIIDEACAEVGIAPLSHDAIRAAATQDLLRANTAAMIEAAGSDVGTPTIEIAGEALFGPVMTPAPKGQAALDLWDGLVLVTRTPGFYELKRSRSEDPIFD